jgi:hypothetical protein
MSIVKPAAIDADLSVSHGVDSVEVNTTHEWSSLIGGYLENVAGLAKGVIDEVLTKKFDSHLPTPRRRLRPAKVEAALIVKPCATVIQFEVACV